MPRKSPPDISQTPDGGANPTGAENSNNALLSRLPLTDILEAMPDAIGVYDTAGNLIFANAIAQRLFGLHLDSTFLTQPAPQRRLQLNVRDLSGEPMLPEQWHLSRLLRGETITSEQPALSRITGLDGNERYISVTGSPIKADGVLLGAISIARDVTHLHALERRTHESLGALLEMAEAVVSVASPEDGEDAPGASVRRVGQQLIMLAQRVLGCNRISMSVVDRNTGVAHALAVAGLTPDEERMWWEEQLAAEARGARLADSSEQEIVQQLYAGNPVTLDLREPRFQDLPNNYGILTLLISPMLIAQQLVGIISLDFADQPHEFTSGELSLASAVSKLAALVIERDRMLREQAISEAEVLALAQANQRMNEFLGIAAHELRTPITVIKANLQMLQRRAAQTAEQAHAGKRIIVEPQRALRDAELLSRTERSLTRLTRLVGDLLDVSRVQAGRLEMRLEPIDLTEVARDAIEEQRLATPDRSISLDPPEGESTHVLADGARVGQVITNFLTNALKYSSATTPVATRVWQDEQTAYVSVTDEGVGIPPEYIGQVWELFYRIPGVEVVSGSGIGLGLGLHLCKTIIERQDGAVGVSSQPGAGSTFWFSLPLLTDDISA